MNDLRMFMLCFTILSLGTIWIANKEKEREHCMEMARFEHEPSHYQLFIDTDSITIKSGARTVATTEYTGKGIDSILVEDLK